jgi:S1-C subfamily serine protease
MSKRVLTYVSVVAALALVLGVGATVVQAAPRAQEVDPELGIVIVSVEADGPAAEAGVVRGDILQEFDGEAVKSSADLAGLLSDREPEDKAEVTVLHGDDLRTLTITLGDDDGDAYLGVTPACELCMGRAVAAFELRLPGATVTKVLADSPAEAAKLEKNDIIMAVDGEDLEQAANLADMIGGHKPGDTVTLTVERPDDEEPFDVEVELAEYPDKEGVAYLGIEYTSVPGAAAWGRGPMGFGVMPHSQWFDQGDLEELGGGEDIQGVIISTVVRDSAASAAGLEKGEVITAIGGQAVEDTDMLVDAIAGQEPGDKITLTIYNPDDDESRDVEVILGAHPDDEEKAYLGVQVGEFLLHVGSEADESGTDTQRFDFRDLMPRGWRFNYELPNLDELGGRLKSLWPWGSGESA